MIAPTTKKEMDALGWDSADVVLFTGDAFIDHPSFGTAVVTRVLESRGYKVAVVPQPNWRDDLRDFKKMGTPRLYFAVNAGNMDSMVNHYTASKRLRSNDAYTPEGRAGYRPDYAVTVYTKILKQLFPDVPVVIGGIEASLRRLTHYDYWQDCLKPSILVDSGADYLVYGMGERPMAALTDAFAQGWTKEQIREIPQIGYLADTPPDNDYFDLHSFEDCKRNKVAFAQNFNIIEREANSLHAMTLVEATGNKDVCINPPYPPATTEELDAVYSLPYTKLPHPRYKGKRIPAYDMIKFSITTHRGCFGG
ncbi:MAG: YgiQ family radical SAM protein, partial [Bacteroidales bacterium]|nr:YgiQ family radical SAM protein [Bacteroidales bacterium]